MANPFTDIISDAGLKELFVYGIDEIINGLSISCRLVYGDTLHTECSNCILNIQTGRSTGIYKSGGPIPFTQGSICPYCQGLGLIPTEATEPISLIVLWNYKDWIAMPTTAEAAQGMVQTLSKMSTTITKLKRAKEIIFDTSIEGFVRHRFGRAGEPNPVGLGEDTYITTMWKRIG